MSPSRGTFIAFATAPGRTASDNPNGRNGLFTQYLLEALSEPGLSLNDVFDLVREEVDSASAGKQLPWTLSSVVGRFSFQPASTSSSLSVPAVPPSAAQTAIRAHQVLPELMHYCGANCITLQLQNDRYIAITRYSWESSDYSSTWIVESFTPESVILHRTDTGSFALTETISGQISADHLINVKEDGKPSKGRLAWGAALNTLPGNNEERDRRK